MMATDSELDVTSLCCPMPLVRLAKAVQGMSAGERLTIVGDDPMFEEEMRDYCEENGHRILEVSRDGRRVTLLLEL